MSLLQRIRQKTRELLHLEETGAKPAAKPAPVKHETKPVEHQTKWVKPTPAPKAKPGPKQLQGRGIDYSYGSGITAQQIKAAGDSFVGRYLSGGNSKDIDRTELQNLREAGVAIVFFWETSAEWMLGGYDAGVHAAGAAKAELQRLGVLRAPVFFTADFDATELQQTPINHALEGAASIVGHPYTALYAGYWPMKRAFDAKKISFGCQTYAWSGSPTKWEPRAKLQQYENGVMLGPAEVDLERSTTAKFGQWPPP